MMTDGEVPLYYEIHGAGPPLLLIAGLASDSRSWQPVLSGLKQNHTLILMDNRGVGRSCQEVKTSIGLMADDAYALVRDLGFDRVNVLGHSMGGMVAMSYALRYPDALDRLLLVSTACQNSARNNVLFSDWAAWFAEGKNRAAWFRTIFTWIFTEKFFQDSQQVDLAVQWLLDDPWPQLPQAFRRQVEAIARWNVTHELVRITSPTYVITGDRDFLFPLEYATQLVRLIPNARLHVIEKAAHSIHMEQPDRFIKTIVDCLGRCRG
ncbi:alpha/beta fold hydrolase [Desulfobulbus propionicus]